MRKSLLILMLASFIATLSGARGEAAEKAMTKAALKNAGLAKIQPITAREGSKIRGEGGSAITAGMSFVSGMLIDPKTKSYVFGVDTNHASTCYDVGCIAGLIDPIHSTESRLQLGLEVETLFIGTITGGAFGGATAYIR
ncbi:MAG: hypothetical protein RLY70_1213 [Planctomycetota bacterium]|jgi:hypothetical protein